MIAARSRLAWLALAPLAALLAALVGAYPASASPATSASPVADAGANAVAGRPAAAAEFNPRYVLLMDTSGSMNDRDPTNRIKLEGAKAAAQYALDAMSASALVSLRTYPDDGGCGAGRKQYDFTTPTDAGLRAAISGLTANGQTPTGPALRAAADDLINAGLLDGATIILVSDGLSNCGVNPCLVAQEVAAQGLAIVNTVGFQISPEGQQELDCIAAATGGQSFTAEDAEALQEAIKDASTPRLEIALTQPEQGLSSPPGSFVAITAVVTNTSEQRADQVRVLVRFQRGTGLVDPGVVSPLRSLGNLSGGQSRTLEWQFRVSPDAANARSHFTVTAVAVNASPAAVSRDLSYSGAIDLANSGALLGDADTHVVILGDSFSSGEGAGNYTSDTNRSDNRCHRSPHTYATTLGYAKAPTILACSGATTKDVRGLTTQYGEKAQVERLRTLADPADVVLLTIGGNDVGFESLIVRCVIQRNCHSSWDLSPSISGDCLRDHVEAGSFSRVGGGDVRQCGRLWSTYESRKLAEVRGVHDDLVATYVAIDNAVNGPRARLARGGQIAPIIVLAYPQLLPHYTQRSCAPLLNAAELRFGADFATALNAQIAEAVEEARGQGRPIYFASDVSEALRPNHTLCDVEPHANKPALDSLWSGDKQELFHPNADGYKDVTAALVRWSNRPEVRSARPTRSVTDSPLAIIAAPPDPVAVIAVGDTPSPNATSLLQGQAVTIQGTGYAPGSTVLVTVRSLPRNAGHVEADAGGHIDGVALLPSDLPPGYHMIVAEGFDASGNPRQQYALIEIRRPFPVGPVGLAGGALVLLVAGLVRLRAPSRDA